MTMLPGRCVCKHLTLDHDRLGCELCPCRRPLGHPLTDSDREETAA